MDRSFACGPSDCRTHSLFLPGNLRGDAHSEYGVRSAGGCERRMTIDSGVGNLQTLKQSARATSKFKLLEPTKFADLNKHYPDKYSKEPEKEELELLGLDDLVKVVFVNSEDMWISVDSCDWDDHGGGLVYGKTCQQAMKLHGLQKGQRVCFDIKCVVEIRYHEDDSDDSEDDED